MEMLELQQRDSDANEKEIDFVELSEVQLAFVGGGIAEVILG